MQLKIETDFFPRLTAWHVRKALKWIDPRDLEALGCIRLMDYEPDDPEASRPLI